MSRQPPGDLQADVLDDRDILLTRDEAARYLRKSPATLERWGRIGFGPRVIKVGRHRRYALAELRAFTGAEPPATTPRRNAA